MSFPRKKPACSNWNVCSSARACSKRYMTRLLSCWVVVSMAQCLQPLLTSKGVCYCECCSTPPSPPCTQMFVALQAARMCANSSKRCDTLTMIVVSRLCLQPLLTSKDVRYCGCSSKPPCTQIGLEFRVDTTYCTNSIMRGENWVWIFV